ncbi:MAG: hypothetical protein Q9216_006615 [Gyalolechia sp. 2 TL-2023]
MHASYKGDEAAVKLLLEAGAHTDVSSFHDETAIFLAAAGGYTSIVFMLLEAGAAPEPAWAKGPKDNSEEGKQQAKEKAMGEPEYRAHARGWTPLMLASQGGHQDIARILLKRGVNREVRSPHDKMAFEIALEMEPIQLIISPENPSEMFMSGDYIGYFESWFKPIDVSLEKADGLAGKQLERGRSNFRDIYG